MKNNIYPYVKTDSNVIFVCFGRPFDGTLPSGFPDDRKIVDLTRYCLERLDPWDSWDGPKSA